MPKTSTTKSAGAKRASGARKRVPPKPTPEQSTPFGRRLIASMEELLETLEAGGMAAVEKKFTVYRAPAISFPKPSLDKAAIVAIRAAVGASQPVFASLLGVSPATVRAWEQGANAPSGIALRFLAEVRDNPDYWKGRLKAAAAS